MQFHKWISARSGRTPTTITPASGQGCCGCCRAGNEKGDSVLEIEKEGGEVDSKEAWEALEEASASCSQLHTQAHMQLLSPELAQGPLGLIVSYLDLTDRQVPGPFVLACCRLYAAPQPDDVNNPTC